MSSYQAWSNQAVEDGSANPLRSFAAHLTAVLGSMKDRFQRVDIA